MKAKRLNVDDIVNEPMPKDDITPDQTPRKKSEGKDSKTDKNSSIDEDSFTSDTNILDDLLDQVVSSTCIV